jgi:IS30 family transposase
MLATIQRESADGDDATEGSLRQFFPKHRKLEEVTGEEIALTQHRLNH